MDFAFSKCAKGQCSIVLSLLACIQELRPVAAALVPLPVCGLLFGRGCGAWWISASRNSSRARQYAWRRCAGMASPSMSRAVVSLALTNGGAPSVGETDAGVVPVVGSRGWVPLAGTSPVGVGPGVGLGPLAAAGSVVPMIIRMMNSMAVGRPRHMASV